MIEHLNYDVRSKVEPLDPNVFFDDDLFNYPEMPSNKKYTILTKNEFINHVRSLMFDLNTVSVSPLEHTSFSQALKMKRLEVPFWVGAYHLDSDAGVLHAHALNYLSTDGNIRKLINHDYFGLILSNFASRAPESEARIVKNRILSPSPAIAQYLQFVYGNSADATLHDGECLSEILVNNEDFENFSPLGSHSLSDAIRSIQYLCELLESAKTSNEENHTFFIDENKQPMVMPNTEFFTKYLFGRDSNLLPH